MSGILRTFDINFSDPKRSYYEGDEVRGAVEVDLKDDMVIDSVVLELSGMAVVARGRERSRWWAGKTSRAGDTQGRMEEQHLNQKVILYTRGQDADLLMTAGRHEFPFQVQLPFNLPSTFVGDHGSIKYIAMATVERPWSGHVTTTKEFSVLSIVDLSLIPHVTEPLHCHKMREEGLLCCASGHMIVEWRLPRKGFIPGEKIKINGEVKNNSKTRIKKTRAVLIQHIRYYGGYHERKQVAMVEKGVLQPGDIDFWREEMEVPPLPPSGLKGSNLMELWYTLKLKVIPTGLSEPLEAATRIIIATVAAPDDGRDGGYPRDDPRADPRASLIPDSYGYDRIPSLPTGDESVFSASDLSYFI